MNRIEFRHSHSYASRPGGVSLPVVLKNGRERSALFAFFRKFSRPQQGRSQPSAI